MHPDEVAQAVDEFVAHVNAGELDAAMQHYEADAVFAPEPGTLVEGAPAIRAALAQLIASRAVVRTQGRTVMRSRDLALYQSTWALLVGGAAVQEAQSSDVLRRGGDGRWRIAIDNPWGAAHLFAMGEHRGKAGSP